jgi:formamidopyrimidine-DNA glycosylase
VPELPEVETVVRLIRPRLLGRTITGAKFIIPRQLHPQTSREILRAIKGQIIRSVARRGKYILLGLDNGTLLIHLRMTGRLYVRPAAIPADPHERAVFLLDDAGDVLALRDPRTLGTIRFFPANTIIEPLSALGLEPLEDISDFEALISRINRHSIAIKPLLLNQSLFAGIGNIYASEALWDARIDPRKPANTLTRPQFRRLIDSIRKVLLKAIERGGSTLKDFADPEGRAGSYQREFVVYDREGEPCSRCGIPILKITQAQRSTYFCKGCQKGKS